MIRFEHSGRMFKSDLVSKFSIIVKAIQKSINMDLNIRGGCSKYSEGYSKIHTGLLISFQTL